MEEQNNATEFEPIIIQPHGASIETAGVSVKIPEGTPRSAIILGAEILIEALIKESEGAVDISLVLKEIKRLYTRDNRKEKK